MNKQIYIGLGGQGGKTICELKKQIHQLQLYKKANPHAPGFNAEHAFLSIDSSPDIWDTEELWSHMGKDLSLKADERYKLEASLINNNATNVVPWLFSDDPETAAAQHAALGTIDKGAPGAQQRRRYGRLLFAANANKVRDAIENTIARASRNDRSESAVFHVFCSLGGGTGSGGIVDLITMIRLIKSNPGTHPINLYVYLADQRGVAANAVKSYFYVNQYSAMRDLDNLASMIFRPHAMINTNNGPQLGTRIPKLETPLNAIYISTNINSANEAVSINEQIKRTASWVLSRATIEEGCNDPNIRRIATGEDLTADVDGEPNDLSGTFVARSYRCGNLGLGRWAAPVDELSLMSAYSIQINSYNQMLYNNLQRGKGYEGECIDLTSQDLAAYNKIFKENFMLTTEVQQAWEQWSVSDPGVQAIVSGTRNPAALLQLSALFDKYFQQEVSGKNVSCSISQPNRYGMLVAQLRDQLGIADDDATAPSITQLLVKHLKQALTSAWDKGAIGLLHAKQILTYCIETTVECHDQLKLMYDNMSDKGEYIAATQERITRRQNEWDKLTSVSYATMGKGKTFLKAHMADLTYIYTIKTQRQHIAEIIRELETHQSRLLDVRTSLEKPITAIGRKLAELAEKYNAITLRRFIEEGVLPGDDKALEYDFNYADSALTSLVKHVQTNTDVNLGTTIMQNAEAMRHITTESRKNDSSIIGLFGSSENIDARTDAQITERSFEMAGKMMAESDRRLSSRIMEGIKSVTENMTTAEFKSKFQRLINTASFSYDMDHNSPDPSIAYNRENDYGKAWVVSFPAGFRLDGVVKTDDELKAEIQAVIGHAATADSVYVRLCNDTTQITVWQTEYSRPARTAQIITTLSGTNKTMEEKGEIRDLFWKDIDEEATHLMCPLTFPDKDERDIMCKGALWFVRNMPNYFMIDEAQGKVIRKASGQRSRDTEIHRLTGQNPITNDTLFAFSVQEVVKMSIRNNKEFTTNDFRNKYKADLDALSSYSEREAFRNVIDAFIEKTLARIDLTARD